MYVMLFSFRDCHPLCPLFAAAWSRRLSPPRFPSPFPPILSPYPFPLDPLPRRPLSPVAPVAPVAPRSYPPLDEAASTGAQRLRAFFAPHNARLCKLLGDPAFVDPWVPRPPKSPGAVTSKNG